jgi:integrase
MSTIRKMFRCTNPACKNPETGKNRGFKKVQVDGQKSAICKHCGEPMKLSANHTTRIMKEGQTFTKSVSPNKEDAAAYLAHCVTSRHSGDLMPGEERLIPWSEAVELFERGLDERLAAGKSKNTDRVYRSRLRLLSKTFGKRTMQSIERYEIDDWVSARRNKVGASDINCCLSLIDQLFNTVLDRNSAKRFPRLQETAVDVAKAKRLTLPPGRDNILETDEQMQELLGECQTLNLYHFCYGILNTGLRHADILKLRISEISWVRNEIQTNVKGGKAVRIPITENYGKFLKRWILRTRPTKDGWLFPSTKTEEAPFRKNTDFGFCRMRERVAKKYEAKGDNATAAKFRSLVPHDLRHTFATHFLYKASKELGATAAVHILSQALGHSTSYITARYSHSLDEVNQAAMKSYGEQMFSNTVDLFQSV